MGDGDVYSILIVDDEEDIIELFTEYFEELGHRVISASNGEDGLTALANNEVHAVLLDLHMPTMDGFGFLKRKAELENFTPVVILTGYGNKTAVIRALRLGVFDFLEKPGEKDSVVRTILDAAALGADLIEAEKLGERKSKDLTYFIRLSRFNLKKDVG